MTGLFHPEIFHLLTFCYQRMNFVSRIRMKNFAFNAFSRCIPWIALLLLSYIGGKMLIEGIRAKQPDEEAENNAPNLWIQGIATSIDALSVGFTIAEYNIWQALLSAFIIGAVTLVICAAGVEIGKKAGMKLAGKATILGGLLLIGIGIEIFVSHLIG